MSTEARQVEDAQGPNPIRQNTFSELSHRVVRALTSLARGIILGVLAPLAIAAPGRFADHAGRHPLVVPITVAVLLVPTWLHAMSRTFGIEQRALILGAFGLAGLWAVATILGIGLVSRWEESDRAASARAASLVFSFGGGFCLFLLVHYYLVIPAIRDFLEPSLSTRRVSWAVLETVITGLRLIGLLVAAIAPVQVFRGLASVGGGTVPALEPLCRGCGYSLEGVHEAYRTQRQGLAARDTTEPVCSECGLGLAASLEADARAGTAWTRGEDLSAGNWWRTLWETIRRPAGFFEHLPLSASRGAAIRFWEWNVLATLAIIAIVFAGNLGICAATGVASPIPISGYEVSLSRVNVPNRFWVPATITAAAAVTWAVVMAGTILLCATAEYVWKRATLLRGRNMHPAGLLTACYLSGHVLAIELAATAASLGVRLAVLAIPESSPIPFEALMALRRNAANVGVAAGLVVAGLGWLALYWPAAMRSGLAMRYANR